MSRPHDTRYESKIEAGRMDLYVKTFSITAMIDEVESIVRALVEKGPTHDWEKNTR